MRPHRDESHLMKMKRYFLSMMAIGVLGLGAIACDDNDNGDNNGPNNTGNTGNIDDGGPSSTQLPGDPPTNRLEDVPNLLRQHFQANFADARWYSELDDIEMEGAVVKIELDDDVTTQDLVEACTAAAGFAASAQDYGIEGIRVEGDDDETIESRQDNLAQCEGSGSGSPTTGAGGGSPTTSGN